MPGPRALKRTQRSHCRHRSFQKEVLDENRFLHAIHPQIRPIAMLVQDALRHHPATCAVTLKVAVIWKRIRRSRSVQPDS